MFKAFLKRNFGILQVLLVPVFFIVISLFVINNYGISWDEPIHFFRGQSYLHYFLTGEKVYPEYPKTRLSYYEKNDLSAKYFLEGGDGGHPPLNDILAAVANHIFFQKLNLFGDIASFHLFDIFSASLAVFVVAIFGYLFWGVIGGIVSAIAMATYPLFWGESHFNIKDPPETGFISFAILAFWMALKKTSYKWLIISAVFSGIALGTKFNAFFIPIILLPFLIVKYIPFIRKGYTYVLNKIKEVPRPFLLSSVACPLIVLFIFFGSWPFLWADPYGNFMKVFQYYKDIGTGSIYQPGFYLPFGFNLYPAYWIIITTPPIILSLGGIGLFFCIKRLIFDKKDREVHILLLSWLIVPIVRVTLPETSIYGGVRQIMEYIPALALLTGLGFTAIIRKFKVNSLNTYLLILLAFFPHIFIMGSLHPNENVYFNFLVGGLNGAYKRNIPYAGNSFGNAYWPLLKWLNSNAPLNSKLALVQGTALNIPDIQLRSDIPRWSDYWSGIERKGEYLIELTHLNYRIAYPYAWDYIERFLTPVSEVKVDGVSIAKLWKNDLEHTKPNMRFSEYVLKAFTVSVKDPDIYITFNKEETISHLTINYVEDVTCKKPVGNFYTSTDNIKWATELDAVPELQISEKDMVKNGVLTYYFPGRVAKYVRLHITVPNSCIFNSPSIKVFNLK